MKKSVIIIIGVIYGLSIVMVTLFGLKHKVFNEIVYVSQVEIVDEFANYTENGTKYVVLFPDEEGKREYQLKWNVSPDNATSKRVMFSYDKQKDFVSVDENGLVTFTSSGAITVTVMAQDGSSQSDSIQIIFIK